MLIRFACSALLGILLLTLGGGPQTAASVSRPRTTTAVKKLPAAKHPVKVKRRTPTRTGGGKGTAAKLVAGKATTSKTRSTGTAAPGIPSEARPAKSSGYATVAAHGTQMRLQATREEVIGRINDRLANPLVGIENAVQLRPFFDQLHKLEVDPKSAVVRVLQFGDSHTAADMFTGALRTLFQGKWGDGGAGFSYPGYPFAGYRIHGTKRGQSIDWTVEGTHFRNLGDDALVGMGGVSLSTERAGSWVSLDADATSLEVQYMTQPGGGPIEIYDGEQLLATESTDGPIAAGRYDTPVDAGTHHFEVRTTEDAPVRLLGLTTENAAGVTYEAMGLNGAEASLLLRWDEALARTYMEQVNPGLIVLAYGTNEASDHTWTEESYAAMFGSLIERFRRMAPNAAILVIGPPDRELRAGRRGWAAFAGVDRIVQAQRATCKAVGCAFWDQRSRMGGFGSMHQWVAVQWAQADHTHFTGEGYTELAGALFMDLVQQYNTYHGLSTVAEGGTK